MLKTIFASLVGLTLMIGGLSFNADDILNDTKSAVNSANLHQLATALELYYSDHDRYPLTSDVSELFIQLESYLSNKPLADQNFTYQPVNDGQKYELGLR